jgi:hypothetical protein
MDALELSRDAGATRHAGSRVIYDESCLAEKDRVRPDGWSHAKWRPRGLPRVRNRIGFLARHPPPIAPWDGPWGWASRPLCSGPTEVLKINPTSERQSSPRYARNADFGRSHGWGTRRRDGNVRLRMDREHGDLHVPHSACMPSRSCHCSSGLSLATGPRS